MFPQMSPSGALHIAVNKLQRHIYRYDNRCRGAVASRGSLLHRSRSLFARRRAERLALPRDEYADDNFTVPFPPPISSCIGQRPSGKRWKLSDE